MIGPMNSTKKELGVLLYVESMFLRGGNAAYAGHENHFIDWITSRKRIRSWRATWVENSWGPHTSSLIKGAAIQGLLSFIILHRRFLS